MNKEDIPWNGYYDPTTRKHICHCGNPTQYKMFTGGLEFYCPHCALEGIYPEGEGGPRARLLTQGPEGIAKLKQQMEERFAERKLGDT